jgi:hypothetical protein
MDTEQRIQAAIAALKSKTILSVRQAAATFSIPRSTLQGHLAGLQPNKTSKTGMQRLTPEEEGAIERTVQQLSLWGWPITIQGLEALARELLEKKGDLEPLGKNWYDKFLVRYPEIKKPRSRAIKVLGRTSRPVFHDLKQRPFQHSLAIENGSLLLSVLTLKNMSCLLLLFLRANRFNYAGLTVQSTNRLLFE